MAFPNRFAWSMFKKCRIEPLPTGSRYVALSYVWGAVPDEDDSRLLSSTIKIYERTGGLDSAKLPNVIKDALEICRGMEEPYLWIDRLGILQDDAKDKEAQIESMADIFRLAHFTLVIACGDSMSDRVPGVGVDRCILIGHATPDGLQIRSILPTLRDMIRVSAWYTRGWTYQEGVLSTRKLFITPVQAIWHCFESIFYEGTHDTLLNDPHGRDPVVSDRSDCARDFQLRGSHGSWESFRVHSSLYNQWTLTHVSDIYNAFGGIRRALYVSSETHACGLPTTQFDAALLWQRREAGLYKPRTSGYMHVDLPSWTWASVPCSLDHRSFAGALVRWQLLQWRGTGEVVRLPLHTGQYSEFGSFYDEFKEWHSNTWRESSSYHMALAVSLDCLESSMCKYMRDMMQDVPKHAIMGKIRSRWPDYADYYVNAFENGNTRAVPKPELDIGVSLLETRAQVASVYVGGIGTVMADNVFSPAIGYTGKSLRRMGNSSVSCRPTLCHEIPSIVSRAGHLK